MGEDPEGRLGRVRTQAGQGAHGGRGSRITWLALAPIRCGDSRIDDAFKALAAVIFFFNSPMLREKMHLISFVRNTEKLSKVSGHMTNFSELTRKATD